MSDVLKFYNRQGEVIDHNEYARIRLTNKRVAETTLPDGKWVSTVWLGIDHSMPRKEEGPPLIFETMVFPSDHEFGDLDMDRYSTEEEALAGHDAMVKKWSEK